jgi:hypothetical protein
MFEWFMELVLKTRGVLQRPRVRIPLSPPYDSIIGRIVREGENPHEMANLEILINKYQRPQIKEIYV